MAVLTDTDIEGILCKDEECKNKNDTLHIYPYEPRSLTPVGYNLRVGNRYSLSSQPSPWELVSGKWISIPPSETVLVTTLENVGMTKSKALSALICSKVSVVSKGLSHISTTIDPDWEGRLLIAVNNYGRTTVRLEHGQPFATAVFLKNQTPATRSVDRPPDRPDVLLKQWSEVTRKVGKLDRLLFWSQPAVVLASLGVGLWLFGNEPGTTAAVAAGVALSQIIRGFGPREI